MKFTNEEWQDIDEARARLQAYKDKVQPYPAYPEDNAPPEIKPIFRARPVDTEIDQLKAGFLFLQRKLAEHTDKAKGRGKY